MTSGGRIPTPLKYRWQRFRYNVLPVLCFAVCVALTLWLWDKQGELPNTVGEVEVVRFDIAAGSNGRLMPLPELRKGYWAPFDNVQQDQVIARLDDEPAQAQLEALQKELLKLRSELESTQMKAALDDLDRQHDHLRQAANLARQVEQYRLEVLDRTTAIDTDRIELQRLKNRLDFLESSRARPVITQVELTDNQLQYNFIVKRIEQNTVALHEAEQQLAAAQARQKGLPPLETSDVAKLLAPIEASIAAQEALVDEVRARIEALEIRSPITGTICVVYCWPGQNVRAGEPILTVAAATGPSIVTYIRQDQRIYPQEGMLVDVRPRAPGARPQEVRVQKVGRQFEPIPPRLLRDPKVPEWGLPVRLALPQKLSLRPGELVDITFRASSKGG